MVVVPRAPAAAASLGWEAQSAPGAGPGGPLKETRLTAGFVRARATFPAHSVANSNAVSTEGVPAVYWARDLLPMTEMYVTPAEVWKHMGLDVHREGGLHGGGDIASLG